MQTNLSNLSNNYFKLKTRGAASHTMKSHYENNIGAACTNAVPQLPPGYDTMVLLEFAMVLPHSD